jgi:hypothetical protein
MRHVTAPGSLSTEVPGKGLSNLPMDPTVETSVVDLLNPYGCATSRATLWHTAYHVWQL